MGRGISNIYPWGCSRVLAPWILFPENKDDQKKHDYFDSNIFHNLIFRFKLSNLQTDIKMSYFTSIYKISLFFSIVQFNYNMYKIIKEKI